MKAARSLLNGARMAAYPSPVPRTWPVLVALGLVAFLALAMVGVDLVVARRVAQRTAEIVDNAQRGVELVDDLRAQAVELAAGSSDSSAILTITGRIAADAQAYEPLTNSPGERDEWNRLQRALARLQGSARSGDTARLGTAASEVGQSIDKLVIINRVAAHHHADAIRRAHRQAIIADASVGVLTFALMGVIALVLLRSLARHRALILAHIHLLDERNRDLDAFAGRAAHDLRGPLNPIRGYADLLSAGKEPPEEVQQMALRIRRAVDRMSRVVDDMLELSRAGRPTPGRACPATVGAEVLDELAPELHGAEVHTQLTLAPIACADGVLAQILRNLLSNAIKFRSRERPLQLRLNAEPDGKWIVLRLEDNGVGMDAESAAHAFEPFYRGRTDREVPGHGLGLAIVERATRALGGHCELTSVPDEGTRIVIRLPPA
jgi:signal transduction histidine kinase